MLIYIDILTLIVVAIGATYSHLIWNLLHHKALRVFLIGMYAGVALRLVILIHDIFEQVDLTTPRYILSWLVWVVLVLGLALLYYEMKRFLKRRK